MKEIDYSIVIPVYYNEGLIEKTFNDLKEKVFSKNRELNCELIFVDDGSGDGSLNELLQLRKEYPGIVKVIKFTRNFGQLNAIYAGYKYAKGKCIITMSADGQDPADLINDMLKAHYDEKYEIVVCTRKGRDESYYRSATSKIFYSLLRKLSFPNLPPGGFDFVLISRKVMNILLKNQEAHSFLQGQLLWTGFNVKFIEYIRLQRQVGVSRWTFAKKLTYFIDAIMGYSYAPLRFISLLGVIVASTGFLYAFIVFLAKIFWDNPIEGWTPLMIVILVLGGTQMLMSGVIGEYLWRVLSQVRNRDMYIIDKVYDD
jgi:dolichol-phosphate mannosyltransferase